MTSRRIGLRVKMILYLAGWHRRRDVWGRLLLPSLDPFPEAEWILRSFGGLQFGGLCERIRLEPAAAIEFDEHLIWRCEAAVGRRLYPIGYQEHQDREALFVDEAGRVYINLGDRLCLLAESFEDALAYLVRPGQARTSRPSPCWPVEDAPEG